MKIEDIVSCLEEELNKDLIPKDYHCLVLHKSVEPTSFNAYTKYVYVLYDVIDNNKLRLLSLNYAAKNEKNEEYLREHLDKTFLKSLIEFIVKHYNNIKNKNYEAIKV